jgi:hypothetical protein
LATPQYRLATIIPERLFAVRIGIVLVRSGDRCASLPAVFLLR